MMKVLLFLLFCAFANGLTIRKQKLKIQKDIDPCTTPFGTTTTDEIYTTGTPDFFESTTTGFDFSTTSADVESTETPAEFTTTESPCQPQTPPYQSDTTTTPPPTLPSSTPPPTTTRNSGPTSCYALIFAGEMSQSITLQEKTNFLNIVLQIARNFQNTNLKFAITTFGITIYQNLNDFQNYNEFVSTVNNLLAGLPSPNSALTYIAPVLDDIYDDVILYSGKGISTLFMGEMEAIRDPNAGYTAALRLASTGKNVYVLDYSSGKIPSSLWPYLTNNHYERIINGTGYDATTIYNQFYSTLITDINNNIC